MHSYPTLRTVGFFSGSYGCYAILLIQMKFSKLSLVFSGPDGCVNSVGYLVVFGS